LCTVDDFRRLCEAAQAAVAKKFCLWRTTSLILSSPTVGKEGVRKRLFLRAGETLLSNLISDLRGRTRGGLSTKISLAVAALGILVASS
jgi:hypothetical protein